MRLPALLVISTLLAGVGSATLAQTNAPSAAPPLAVETPPANTPPVQLPPAADLTGLNLRIEADEVVMTRLRAGELAQENARIRAIKPALPFHGRTWLPPVFWGL